MNLHVFDTYARTFDGKKLHFDILLQKHDQGKAIDSANRFLSELGVEAQEIDSSSCQFCHSSAQYTKFIPAVQEKGFVVIKLEGFD